MVGLQPNGNAVGISRVGLAIGVFRAAARLPASCIPSAVTVAVERDPGGTLFRRSLTLFIDQMID
jgi:hypothetical protein